MDIQTAGKQEKATAVKAPNIDEQAKTQNYPREVLSQFTPDKTFETEQDEIQAVCEMCREAKTQLQEAQESNQRIYELIEANPVLADVIMDMDKGVPFEVALAKNIDIEALIPVEGEVNYDAYQAASKDREKREKEIVDRRAALEANQAQSKTDADEFFEELGIDEAEQMVFVDFVESFIGDLFAGKVAKITLKKMYQAFKYEEDLADAAEQGQIAGRNQTIQAKRTTNATTDGIPDSGASVEAVGDKKPARKVFEL